MSMEKIQADRNRVLKERYYGEGGILATLHSAIIGLERVLKDEQTLRDAALADPDMRTGYENLGPTVSALHWKAMHTGSLLPLESDPDLTPDEFRDII